MLQAGEHEEGASNDEERDDDEMGFGRVAFCTRRPSARFFVGE